MKKQLFFLLVTTLLVCSCSTDSVKADLIISNANIWTGNTNSPKAEAMAVKADTILAIGSLDDIHKFKGSDTEIKDVGGKFITPGFIDTHVHL